MADTSADDPETVARRLLDAADNLERANSPARLREALAACHDLWTAERPVLPAAPWPGGDRERVAGWHVTVARILETDPRYLDDQSIFVLARVNRQAAEALAPAESATPFVAGRAAPGDGAAAAQ